MDVKEELKNNILVDMKPYVDPTTLSILEQIIVKHTAHISMEQQTSLASVDDINTYIVQLFYLKKAPKLSEYTITAYLGALKNFNAVINKPFTVVDSTDIEYYLLQKYQKGNSGVSLNNELLCLSAMFDFMKKNGIVSNNPCDSVERYPVEKKPIEHLDALDMDALRFACTTKRQRAVLELLRSTALRRGEVATIKVSDVDFDNNRIMVYGKKNRTYRLVYIDSLAKKYLKDYLDTRKDLKQDDPLFIAKNGNPITPHGVYDLITNISKKANLKRNAYPHLLRKTTATNICKRGGTEDEAGAYLGHTQKSVTGRHYIYRGDEYVESIFKKYVDTN